MIDTVHLTQPLRMHARHVMRELNFEALCGHDRRYCTPHERWKRNPPGVATTLPRLTWSAARDGRDYLTVALSLPKLLLGSNVEMVMNQNCIDWALVMISQYVSEATRSEFNAKSANVTRIDFCHNWNLTPIEVYEYLRVVAQASLPRMRRDLIGKSTVCFSNKSQVVEFYDKLSEVLSRLRNGKASDEEVTASVGVLRFEKRFLTNRACERLALKLGLANRRAESLLRVSVAESVMNETMKELGLDKASESGDARLARLLRAYGPKRALTLVGFLALCDSYGADNLVRLGICKRSSYYKMRRDIIKVGAWLFTDSKRSLPPLQLVRSRAQLRAA